VARRQFAQRGYEAATLRLIAAAASVDPALIVHFFGSKQRLFAEAMKLPFDAAEARAAIIDGPRSQLGRRMAAFFLEVWEDPTRGDQVRGVLRAATTSEDAAALLREMLGRRLMVPLAEHLGGPDASLRTSLCAAHLVGVGIARYIVGLEPLASAPADRVVEIIAPALQRYLTHAL
jgi:AcrR family transcriptional regulator